MTNYKTMEELCEIPVFRHFYDINQIPRGTFNEKQISDFLKNFGLSLGFDTVQDETNNVLIRKPASKGYENAPIVILQAHMDMVCEKKPEALHDFNKDPIPMCIEGDFITTGGKTTLGADDGIGVAYMMAILEDKELCHPELEVLFTTREEEDFGGALGVNLDSLKGKYLINLDHGVENQILCGSCGGTALELTLKNSYTQTDITIGKDGAEKYEGYKLWVKGLSGGHSGEDIHRGIGNANVLLARLLNSINDHVNCYLGHIEGGSTRSALPREASAVLLVDCEGKEEFENIVKTMSENFREEHGIVSPNIEIGIAKTDFKGRVLDKDSMQRLINILYLSPNGISEMNGAAGNVVESSDNIGIISMDEKQIRIIYEIRATYKSTQAYICEKIEKIARLSGAETRTFCDYPSWIYRHDCKLKELAYNVYRRKFDKEPQLVVVHAGIECGCFFKRGKELSAISIGPDCFGFHSPEERANIPSVKRVYEFLQEMLEEMK